MADRDLDLFVREALAAGQPRGAIAAALRDAGWAADRIDDALAAYAESDFPVPVPRPRRYGSAREAFLYIVYFALLGVVAGYAGALAFAFIEALFADELARAGWRGAPSGLRWGVAALIVGYPVFLYLGARLGAARRANPQRRASRVRAWLTYVTLIFAALALIGDLISVVYHFLSGELGARFLSKAAVVGVISGAILWHYGRDADGDAENRKAGADWPGRVLAAATTVVVAALIVWAFTIIRTPQTARASLADEQRLRDLGVIVRLVDCHRTYEGATPADLAALDEALSARAGGAPVAPGCGARVPGDPVGAAAYDYAPLAGDAYRVCMTFQRGWPETREPADRSRRLDGSYDGAAGARYVDAPQGPGAHCFEFTAIDFEAAQPADRP